MNNSENWPILLCMHVKMRLKNWTVTRITGTSVRYPYFNVIKSYFPKTDLHISLVFPFNSQILILFIIFSFRFLPLYNHLICLCHVSSSHSRFVFFIGFLSHAFVLPLHTPPGKSTLRWQQYEYPTSDLINP